MNIFKRKTFILFFILTILIVFQIRYLNFIGDYVQLSDISAVNSDISDIKISINNINLELEELIKIGNESKEIPKAIKKKYEKLSTEISDYMKYAGLTNVEGEGVIIIIDDADRILHENENPSSLMVHDLDLRILVDELNNNGAEVVSINGIRVAKGLSKIVCKGPTISINDREQAQPYIIRAIGDRFKLYNAITAPESPASTLKKIGLTLNVYTKKNISINKYYDSTLDYLMYSDRGLK